MLSRCPGSAKCPVRTTRPHPVLLFYTDAGWLCVSSLWSTMRGVAGEDCGCDGCVLFSICSSPSFLLWVTTSTSIPQKADLRGQS